MIHIFLILLLLLLTPIVLNFTIFEFSSNLTNGKLEDWFTFFASYFGGIIGGAVAFLIAKLQIDSNRKDDRIKQLANELPGYIMIQIELKKWKKIIIKVNENKKSIISEIGEDSFKEQLLKDFLDIDIEFKTENWEKKWLIKDPILLEELIQFEEMFKHSYEYLTKDFTEFINQFKVNIKYVGNQVLMPEDPRKKLELELQAKQEAFNELEYIIEKITKIEVVLLMHIEHIHNFIEFPKKYDLKLIRSQKDDFKVKRDDGITENMHFVK